MQRLAPDLAVDVAKRLLTCEWSWKTADLDKALGAAGLTMFDPGEDATPRIEHPALPGVASFVTTLADQKTVLDISVTLTELIDETDAAAPPALAVAHQAYKTAYKTALEQEFGKPTGEQGAVWDRGDCVLELLHLDIAVVLVVANKASRRKRQGG